MCEAVRLVVWDLDETFWKGTLTEGGIREYVQAHHDTVIELARRGIMSSICSKNDSGTILAILEAKGIREYFIFPSISWESKGMRLAQLVETIQLRPATIMFIDDNPNNRAEAAALVPGLQIEDETFIGKMLDDPRFKGKDDSQLTRLKQYKLLEERRRDAEQAAGSNEDFLRNCDIRVYIEYDVEANIDRAIELINRTNQLNYTKRRLPEQLELARKELSEQLRAFDRSAGLVKVADKYGDYGFVGFFMTGGMRKTIILGTANTHLVHYCFSCRTLGMLIESWVYEFLGRPELEIVGEVLTDLSVKRDVDWVRQVRSCDDFSNKHDKIAPQIILYGGCEVNAIGVYLQSYTDRLDVYGNYVANGVFVSVNYAARMIDVSDRDISEISRELELLHLPANFETGDYFADAAPGAVFVLNFGMDAGGGDRLRHKTKGWYFLLSPNGLGWETIYATSDSQFNSLLESSGSRYSEDQKAVLRDISKHIRINYERITAPDEFKIAELMQTIILRIPLYSKLIIICDHDQRKDDVTGEILAIAEVDWYRKVLNRIVSPYPYVSVISISDAICRADDLWGGNHYSRAVYRRLSENIIAAIKRTEPRTDAPLRRDLIANYLAAESEKQRREVDAREFVQAAFERLFRRPPDPQARDYFIDALATGKLSAGNFVRALTGGIEFEDKWIATSIPASARQSESAPSTLIDPRLLRVPSELTRAAIQPKRVLIIGSCLSEGWAHRLKSLPEPCECDIYLQGRDLPDVPEQSMGSYDFQIVQLGLRFVLPDAAFARLSQAHVDAHEKLFAHVVNGIQRHLENAMRWNREHGVLTFVFPFVVPLQNPVGRLLPRYDLRNPVFFIERMNEALCQEMGRYSNAFFFDLNEIQSFYGKRYVQEDGISAINHGAYIGNFDFEYDANRLEPAAKASDFFESKVHDVFLASWRELVALYNTVRQTDAVKLVVIDLDDTLWRGVIAENDAEDMPTSEGWPKGFWEALLFLKRRGILLAIISKNEESRVVEAWDKLVSHQLKLDDFAISRINWRPKPENMADILAHVHLLPSNVVYIDDNPAERAGMKGAYPDMRVLGGTPLTWRRILLWSSETQVPTITAESSSRTEMVRAQVVREEKRATMSREEFLASLDVRMKLLEVRSVDHPRFPRVFELINKTNQFNTTGKRWTREECGAAFASGTTIHAFEVADLYTEYGLVGALMVDADGIRQFVMSCRVMGLEAEVAAVARVGDLRREAGSTTIFAAMIETNRNQPCRNLYSRFGFEAVEGGWRRSLDPWFEAPAHIALTIEQEDPETIRVAAE